MVAITTALALAEFVPDVIGLFSNKRGKQAEEAMSAVEKIAEKVTGKKGNDAVNVIQSDPKVALEFKKAVMNDKYVADQIALEDRKDARQMYSKHHEATDETARWIMKFNLPAVVILSIATIIAIYYLRDNGTITALISSLATMVIKDLLTQQQQVCAFRFGSSVGSKLKEK